MDIWVVCKSLGHFRNNTVLRNAGGQTAIQISVFTSSSQKWNCWTGMVILCLIFEAPSYSFLSPNSCTIYVYNAQGFQFLCVLTKHLLVPCLDSSQPNDCEVVAHCEFDLHFPNNLVMVCIFLCFWPLCISPLENVFSGPFVPLLLYELSCLVSLCCGVVGVLYLFWISFFFSGACCANIFSCFVGSFFHSVDNILWYTEAFNFYEVQFICFLFCCLCFCHCTQEIIVSLGWPESSLEVLK